MTFPVTVEDDDTSFLDAEAPEPGSFLVLGVGLAAVGFSRRRKTN
jgi:PEP-CTERM motif